MIYIMFSFSKYQYSFLKLFDDLLLKIFDRFVELIKLQMGILAVSDESFLLL